MNKIETHLSQKDYIKVNFYFTYRKISIKLFTGIGAFVLFISIVNIIIDRYPSFPTGELIFGIVFVFGIPLLTYLSAKRNYKTNARISEKITYSFDPEMIKVNGESFNSEMTWNKMFKVTESKDWMLLWQNRQVANIIPKRDLNIEQLNELRSIISSIPGLKSKMKK